MTIVASGRSAYETLILALCRNIKGVKILQCHISSYASRGTAYIHTTSAFVQIRTVCSRRLKFVPLPQGVFELFTYDYRHEGRSGGYDVTGGGNVN